MKTLILVRHAQAADKLLWLEDHGRYLTDKGLKQSKKLSKILKKLDLTPQYLISSTATRCHDTAQKLADTFDLRLHTDASLYFQWIDPYLAAIAKISDDIDYLTVVWHNDDLSILIRHLLNCDFPSVAKWSATIIKFDVDSWSEVIVGKLRHYLSS